MMITVSPLCSAAWVWGGDVKANSESLDLGDPIGDHDGSQLELEGDRKGKASGRGEGDVNRLLLADVELGDFAGVDEALSSHFC